MQKLHDFLVIGAGPAGATAARLLARDGFHVALIEKTPFPRAKVCGEFISATSRPLLSETAFDELVRGASGPEVKRVGMFAREISADAPMPFVEHEGWGKAFAREQLELVLLQAAAAAGADIWQPWKVTELQHGADGHTATLSCGDDIRKVTARQVIVATGSWERNPFTGLAVAPHQAGDLLAFKGRFRNDSLPMDLMPLIAFPGGYGGMVHTGGGLLSLSFCIRRDVLQNCRDAYPGRSAAEAGFQHIVASCTGARNALSGAELEGHWLAAGPIRPGMRKCYVNGIFHAGNLAGEAHPVVAEGISMAMQSAWLLWHALTQHRDDLRRGEPAAKAGRIYARDWRNAFAGRIRAAALFAKLAMHPGANQAARAASYFPQLLSLGARLSGKAVRVAR